MNTMAAGDQDSDNEYYLATKQHLLSSLNDSTIGTPALNEIRALNVERVLDVGSGIGQALFPLAVRNGAFGVGVDVSALGLGMGREFYATHFPKARVTFVRASAELLPFAPDSFDVINCGLALPYMRNRHAIGEMARILRPGGVFLLKIHHARYYLREFWQGVITGNLSLVIHGGRVLAAGTLYHVIQRQPWTRYLNESYQTRWLLRRELATYGLAIEREQTKTNPLTPAFVIRKARPAD